MNESLQIQELPTFKTVCGREFCYTFKTMKLVRDEQHNCHVVYKTFADEYIYSFCNPFQDTFSDNTYNLISEEEAKHIFMPRLSQQNASELFSHR